MTPRRTSRLFVVLSGLAVLAGIGYALWWRKHPSPCPYSQRFWIALPRPAITRSRLREILDLQPGERVLEVGPGTGYYALPVARWLEPDGTLHVLDIQREMLDHTQLRAREQGSRNIVPSHGDVQDLPYPDDSFDAAYLVTVLGEVPDPEHALKELHRTLKPGGRLVVGELVPDPHFVPLDTLQRRANRQGFEFVEKTGTRFGYFALFRAAK